MWETARVCPIFKSGSRSDIKNYRAVSLSCSPAKALEHTLYKP